jgi:hypothetical protein
LLSVGWPVFELSRVICVTFASESEPDCGGIVNEPVASERPPALSFAGSAPLFEKSPSSK